ncbi:NACHT domain protein [Aspergillus glaucus CBS 516.65]|uniref:Nephrocystin 3-like N-terminal domain-containing protein n=1 Tax=Aspergillus glaucus CBS 516.65 TaxID=1160497 RepID=A0A1L9VUN9_ASPGL|nr:hypothetical protein ASPGLDRAFT_71885 [Aspergillus glaucus CBS 516.65]OJJ87625.1 hypothetical protein ASPGLDRAFT_71885 [Aspergillus glaucus CBS 516.65]
MATSFQSHIHHSFEPHTSDLLFGGRRVSDILRDGDTSITRRNSRKSSTDNSALTEIVHSLANRSSSDILPSRIIGADYETILEWVSSERMRKLPAEGSSYDKVLVWARLFVERLHSFDLAVESFAGDNHMAAQLAYVHCASLLGLGEENSSALLDLFGFFYRCSMGLGNLLDRAELFIVSQNIRDQLTLALADLVTLVVGVSNHFLDSLGQLTSGSVSIDIYSTFAAPIESFRTRCEYVAELMWSHQLAQEGVDTKVAKLETIRQWLEPEDPVLANITESTAHFAQEREESTCLWLMPYLNRFLKGEQHTMAITGRPGSGKSILATVINDHLQYPIGGVNYKSIFVPINSRVPVNTTPRAVAKSILSQLFAGRIGNVDLYQILSGACSQSQKPIDNETYDNTLWTALGNALQASLKGAKELVLVIDGVDEASCGQSALLTRLRDAAANASKLKLIVLASEEESAAKASKAQTTVHITPELIFDDVAAVVQRVFQDFPAFGQMSEEQRELNVTRITEAANGSFLWGKLATKKIRDENHPNAESLDKAIDSLVKANLSVSDLVSHRLGSNLPEDGKKILSWLAIASRPMTLRELSALLSVQLDKGTIVEQESNPLTLLEPVTSLVLYQGNMLYLRHGQIRAAITDASAKGSLLPAIKNRHADLAQRLLLYVKRSVANGSEPSLTPSDELSTTTQLEKYPLLDFALRYWVNHVKTAFGCTTDQEINTASKELRPVMPTTPAVPLLETTVWKNKPTPALVSLRTLETSIYEQVFTSNHAATLQAVLCQALAFRPLWDTAQIQATQVFYHAVKTCQNVLSVQHVITMQITKEFLDITASRVTASKTDVMTKRTEMLQLLVECYKIHYGATSEMVVSASTQLSEHYKSIKEEHKAQEVLNSIQGTSTESHPRSKSLTTDESLLVQLHGRRELIQEGTILALDEKEEDDLLSWSYNFDSMTKQAEKFTAEGNVKVAERTYVEIWQRTSRDFRLERSSQLELQNIKATLLYSKFLQSQKRDNEASSVLSGFWEEYEHTMSSSEAVASQLMEVAKVMKSVGLSCTALNVFKKCAQNVNQQSSLHKELQNLAQSTSKEVMQSAGTSTSTMTESSLQEMVFGSTSASASKKDQFSSTATTALVQMYISQHRWRDATKTLKKILLVIWSALFVPSVHDVVLPSENVEHCVDLSESLKDCYRYRHRSAKEEDICLRLYHAVRRSRPAGDKLLDRVTKDLLRVYERTSQTEKLIPIHQDILNNYSKRFGEGHPTVLRELRILAEMTHSRAESVDYYSRIFKVLNKDSNICHRDAFEPLLSVVTELFNQGRFLDALQPFTVLFNTLPHTDVSPKLQDQTFVKSVFDNYVQCLRLVQGDVHVIHDVAAQYRKTCTTVFGTTASITIQATQTLANICRESTKYESEAVQLYEELLKTQSNEVEIDHEDIRATLDAIYEDQCASVSSSTESVSKEQMQKVISVRSRRLATTRSTYGWAHQDSLSQMDELVSLYAKRGETHSAVSLLQETAIQVLVTETSTTKLTAAAKHIASSFIETGQVHRAKELSQEIYRQIVAKDTVNISTAKFDLTVKHRRTLAFLAQFEYSIREREESSLTVNEIYSSLTAEYLYFEQFRAEISSAKASSFQSIIGTVSRLHGFLRSRSRWSPAARLVDQFTNYFVSTQNEKIQVSAGQAKVFISALLEYFSTHTSHDFLRSVAIASYNRVEHHLSSKDYQSASDLALTSFKFIRAHDGFSSSVSTIKLGFKLGLAVSGRDIQPRPDPPTRKNMLSTSAIIMTDILGHCKLKKIDLSQLDLLNLNNLIGLLDEQKDYNTLEWVLSSLWNSRERHAPWQQQSSYTLALGRMLVITRYLVGDYMAAIRLAEDMVYNSARVHGPRHTSSIEMTILLSQMYTSVAQGYQNQKDRRDLAYRYYRKAAGLHENALRVFIDPSATEMLDTASSGSESEPPSPGEGVEEQTGKYVRKHLHLLKLAVERLGNWPKEYSEYERLSSELFSAFGSDLKGIEGVDKWNLKNFGSGRAEASDDLISVKSYPGMGLEGHAVAV